MDWSTWTPFFVNSESFRVGSSLADCVSIDRANCTKHRCASRFLHVLARQRKLSPWNHCIVPLQWFKQLQQRVRVAQCGSAMEQIRCHARLAGGGTGQQDNRTTGQQDNRHQARTCTVNRLSDFSMPLVALQPSSSGCFAPLPTCSVHLHRLLLRNLLPHLVASSIRWSDINRLIGVMAGNFVCNLHCIPVMLPDEARTMLVVEWQARHARLSPLRVHAKWRNSRDGWHNRGDVARQTSEKRTARGS